MPVPSSIDDLSETAGSNFPTGAESPSSTDDYFRAYAAFIAILRDSRVPVGGICMYDGLIADLTDNWKVCDGTNGTPDLRDKFIVGAGTTYALGATGGSKDLIVPSHTHTASFTGSALAAHGHAVIDPQHQHFWGSNTQTQNAAGSGNYGGNAASQTAQQTAPASTGISINSASAGTPSGTVTVNSTGSSATNANLPPYYALIYIKRVS